MDSAPLGLTADDARAIVEALVDPDQTLDFHSSNKSPAEKMLTALRVMEMGSRGMTDRAIGQELGCSHTTVQKYRRLAFSTLAPPMVSEARQQMVLVVDNIIEANMALALTGDDKAAGTVLKALDRKAKLLGLDAPILVDQTTTEVTAEEREAMAMIAQMERDQKMAEDARADDHAQS